MKKQLGAVMAIGVLIVIAAACSSSFTTANISKFEFGKNETATPSTTTFDVGDKMYAVATVSNNSGKFKMDFTVTTVNVSGVPKDKEVLSKSIDSDGSRPIWLQFSLNLPGEYKVEATLSDESGKKIDSKSGTVTLKGSAAPPTTTDSKKDEDDDK